MVIYTIWMRGAYYNDLGGFSSSLQRMEEGKLEASARIDAKKNPIRRNKRSTRRGGTGYWYW